jgi:hypothetical protein
VLVTGALLAFTSKTTALELCDNLALYGAVVGIALLRCDSLPSRGSIVSLFLSGAFFVGTIAVGA